MLEKHLSVKQVTVLTGMRRTGKATLVKQLMEASDIEHKLFFDLENQSKSIKKWYLVERFKKQNDSFKNLNL